MTCPRCGGCTNNTCHGCNAPRQCAGTHLGYGCNRCPHTVFKPEPGTRGGQRLPCMANARHTGICHWDPELAGTQPDTKEQQ